MPLAAKPARTNAALPLRSEAITGAPVKRRTPRTMAVCTEIRMLPPMRTIAGTCMKRFSKMLSYTTPAPSARHMRAMICACMSVGKPG